jgi:cytoplasmic iron level regulating protein YaaA (DUF328/UPF0246 family)
VLLLLPPSEGKTGPESGPKFNASKLGYPGLKNTRSAVLNALISLCAKNPGQAATVIGLGPKQRELVAVNAALRTAACAPAIDVYTGVLYEAWDFASLPAAARKRADARVAIASALFGLVRPSDPIPAYRLSGDTTLPGLGSLSSIWKESLGAELAKVRGPIVDLRSGAYVALGPIPESVAHRAFLGRILLERGGKRSVVSHHNKATKGRIARAVLEHGTVPKSVEAVPDFFRSLGFTCEIREPKKDTDPLGLDIIVKET